MSETPKPSQDKQGLYEAFIAKYNLNPAINSAIMNCLFELHQALYIQMKRIEKIENWQSNKIFDNEDANEVLKSLK